MFAGHLAAGLAIKAGEPRAPTWALLLGVGLIDILFGAFVLVGIEHVTVTPGQAPGFRLDFIDWSHSLAMSLVWALVYAAFFFRRGIAIATWCGFAVFSHFLLDYPMHPGDLALWPHSSAHVGLGFWTSFPHGWWLFELAFISACGAYYVTRARRLGTFGGRAWIAMLVVLVFHVVNSPWLSPAS
jgi:membrane-bound metal-dependent hydrolase YbcI (DUF457 family)